MNRKIRNTLFFLLVLVLIFDNIPKPIQLGFIGGPVGNKLEVYPLLVGFLYSFYCQYKYKNIFIDFKLFIRYLLFFMGVMTLSTILGLIFYPYYDLVLNGPVEQIAKLPIVLSFLHAHGIHVDSKFLMQVWIIARQIKGIVMESFWCFGGAYMIYCWYKNEWNEAVTIMVRGIVFAFLFLFAYALIEIPYLMGIPIAADILSTINPYIHTVVTNHGWWPPLLWKGQLRLVFPEPSHVGNFIAIGLPIIWYMYFNPQKKLSQIALPITVIMSFLVFLTKARTAWAMLFGMLVLLFCLIVYGGNQQYRLLKKYGMILACVVVGFIGFIQISSYGHSLQSTGNIAIQSIESNLGSLTSENKRSNGARYALLKAHFRTGAEHPVLGVGKGLTSAYVHDHFTAEEAKNKEVASWIKYQAERGPMATGYSIPDAMNEFVSRFSSTGILGTTIFFFPFAYVIFQLLKQWKRKQNIVAMFMAFALISSIVAGCNGSVNLLYAVWLLLGLGYAITFGTKEKKNMQ